MEPAPPTPTPAPVPVPEPVPAPEPDDDSGSWDATPPPPPPPPGAPEPEPELPAAPEMVPPELVAEATSCDGGVLLGTSCIKFFVLAGGGGGLLAIAAAVIVKRCRRKKAPVAPNKYELAKADRVAEREEARAAKKAARARALLEAGVLADGYAREEPWKMSWEEQEAHDAVLREEREQRRLEARLNQSQALQSEYSRLESALKASRADEDDADINNPPTKHERRMRKAGRRAALLTAALKDSFAANGLELADIFKFFDDDNDGCITAEEFRTGLQKLNVDLSEEQVVDLMSFMDEDNDGTIDEYEFANTYAPDPSDFVV